MWDIFKVHWGPISRDSDPIGTGSDLGIIICQSSQGDFYNAAKYEKCCIIDCIPKWVDGGAAKGVEIMPCKRELKKPQVV